MTLQALIMIIRCLRMDGSGYGSGFSKAKLVTKRNYSDSQFR